MLFGLLLRVFWWPKWHWETRSRILKSSLTLFSYCPFPCDPRDLISQCRLADQPQPHLTHVPSVFKGGTGVKCHTTCIRLSAHSSLSLSLSIVQQAESRLQLKSSALISPGHNNCPITWGLFNLNLNQPYLFTPSLLCISWPVRSLLFFDSSLFYFFTIMYYFCITFLFTPHILSVWLSFFLWTFSQHWNNSGLQRIARDLAVRLTLLLCLNDLLSVKLDNWHTTAKEISLLGLIQAA